jgi:hypothetical protein
MEATKEAVVASAPKALIKETTIFIEVKSELDGRVYNGNFTFRRLSIGQIAQMGVEVARLNGGLKVDENTDFLNTMLATFRFAVVSAPDWWKPEEMFDTNAVATVYNKYLEFESSFRRSVQPQAEAAPKAG